MDASAEMISRESTSQFWDWKKPQPFSCLLHKITPRQRTMGIGKPMKEIVAGLELWPAFPRSIFAASLQISRNFPALPSVRASRRKS